MKKHITFAAMLALILSLILCGCSSEGSEAPANDEQIINGIVEQFMPLAEIPRQSGNEKAVSDYLVSWAAEHGYEAMQDEVNNVMFTVPATEGMENVPETILQAHMDMVIAIADGKEFNPDTDAITVINDGKTLTADGTSLGADDGIGIATILYTLENSTCHGPLRVIITVDEEVGSGGASALSADWVKDASYVINLDSETSYEVINSAAACVSVSSSATFETAAPQKSLALCVEVKGLTSGHSGLNIDAGRQNGIKAISQVLSGLSDNGINFELSEFTGGSAMNAIPASASAVIVIDPEDESRVTELADSILGDLKAEHTETDPNMQYSVSGCPMPKRVLSAEAKENAVKYTAELFDGVFSMDKNVEGLVESSSNLGLIALDAQTGIFTAISCIRSNSVEKLDELINLETALAETCGMASETEKAADAWPVKPDSRLIELAKEAYSDVTGKELSVVQVHAGIECGTFALLKPELDIIAMGFDISDPHTINETVDLTTVPVTYHVLENILAGL